MKPKMYSILAVCVVTLELSLPAHALPLVAAYSVLADAGTAQLSDFEIAKYRAAAGQGDRDAQWKLALAFREEAIATGSVSTFSWILDEAECWHSGAHAAIGSALQRAGYYDGAIDWLRRSASENDPDGLYYLGNAYARGEGVEQDQQMALSMYASAAAFAHWQALGAVGLSYALGRGTEQDVSWGYNLLKIAADNDDSIAPVREEIRAGMSDEEKAVAESAYDDVKLRVLTMIANNALIYDSFYQDGYREELNPISENVAALEQLGLSQADAKVAANLMAEAHAATRAAAEAEAESEAWDLLIEEDLLD